MTPRILEHWGKSRDQARGVSVCSEALEVSVSPDPEPYVCAFLCWIAGWWQGERSIRWMVEAVVLLCLDHLRATKDDYSASTRMDGEGVALLDDATRACLKYQKRSCGAEHTCCGRVMVYRGCFTLREQRSRAVCSRPPIFECETFLLLLTKMLKKSLVCCCEKWTFLWAMMFGCLR